MAAAMSQTVSISARSCNAGSSRTAVAPKASFMGSTRALSVARPVRSVARQGLTVKAADRPMWLTGATAPAHLDGTLPGDYGFDPLGLGAEPERLKWYVEAERIHGRWAMAAVAGILFPPLLGVDTVWYEAGSMEYALPFLPLVALQFPLMGFLETKRFEGWKETGECGLVNTYPFDPMGMKSSSMATKEVKNGRLAMLAVVGFAVQALVTHESPLVNLTKHIASPSEYNLFTSIANLPQMQ